MFQHTINLIKNDKIIYIDEFIETIYSLTFTTNFIIGFNRGKICIVIKDLYIIIDGNSIYLSVKDKFTVSNSNECVSLSIRGYHHIERY